MLQVFIFHNSDMDGQAACTKTSFAVEELLQDVKREQVVSIQTTITPYTFDGYTSVMCTVTVVIDVAKAEDAGYIEPTAENYRRETDVQK